MMTAIGLKPEVQDAMRTSENATQQTPAGKSQVVLLCELVMVFGLEVNTHRTTLTEKFTRRTR